MSLSILSRSERRMPVAMALVFLPWLAVVLFTAGLWSAINFLGYAITVFAAGYSIVGVALPAPRPNSSHLSRSRARAPGNLGSDGVLAEAGTSAYLGPSSLARIDWQLGYGASGSIAPSGRKAPSPTAGR